MNKIFQEKNSEILFLLIKCKWQATGTMQKFRNNKK
jgi:hypothetical protein